MYILYGLNVDAFVLYIYIYIWVYSSEQLNSYSAQ